MYGKSYESKYDGSMVGAGINVFAVWDYITTKCRNGYIEINPELLAFLLGGKNQDVKEITDALEFLQQPDPKSRSKLEGGRRIVREGEYQYRVVNWAEYNRIRTEEERRDYNRIKQQEFRDKHSRDKKSKKKKEKRVGVTPAESAYCAADERGDQKACDRIAAASADKLAAKQRQENGEYDPEI